MSDEVEAGEPYIIRAGDFKHGRHERQVMSSTRWTDQLPPLGYIDDELIVVRDRPKPLSLQDVIEANAWYGEGLGKGSERRQKLVEKMEHAIREHFDVTPKAGDEA